MKPSPVIDFLNMFFGPGSSGSGALFILKLVILFCLSIYLVFGLVVIRQISIMTSTIKTPLTGQLRLLGYVHMIIAIFVWFAAFTTL